MKKNLKLFFAFFAIVLLGFGLVACGGSGDKKKVKEALEKELIHYTSPDTKDSVTKDLTLLTKSGEVIITWASDKPNVIAIDGKVVRQSEDTTVTLTATLKLGKAEESVDFTLKVIKKIDYEDILSRVTLNLEKDGAIYVTDKDIVLPQTFEGHALVWSSADVETIAVDGKVTRPKFGTPDKVVTLTVSTGGEEVTILVKVLAEDVEDPADILAEAHDLLLIPGTSDGVAADLDLPLVVGQKGVTVTWKSSNTDVITDAGKVTLGDEQVTVVMTATLHLEGYEGDPITKEFSLLVHVRPEGKKLENLAAILNLEETPKDTYVKVEGVTVVGITNDGFMIYDGSLLVFVYDGVVAKKVEVGKVYDIEGATNIYYGAVQLQKGKAAAEVVVVKDSEKPVSVLEPVEVPNIKAYLDTKPTSYGDATPFGFEYIKINAYAKVLSASDNYGVVLVDNLAGDFTTGTKQPTDPINTNGVVVYYQSNKDAVAAFDGLKVTVNVFLYGLRTDRRIFSVIYTGDSTGITFDGTDQEVVDVVESLISKEIKANYFQPETLLLHAELLGATITWESDKPEIINATTGEVVVPDERTLVNLKATITKGEVTKEVIFKVNVGDMDIITIAAAKAISSGDVKVKGILTALAVNQTYFIQDATGGLSIYVRNATTEVVDQLNGAIGKEIEVIGSRGAYNGLEQLVPVYVVVGDTQDLPQSEVIPADFADAEALLPLQSKLVSIKNVKVSAYEKDQYDNISFNLTTPNDKVIEFRWDSRVSIPADLKTKLEAVKDGDVYDIDNLILTWFNNPQLAPSGATSFEDPILSDADQVDKVALYLQGLIKEVYSQAQTLELPELHQTVAIEWTSDKPEHFSNAGVIVLPETGQVDVVLTVKLTLNEEIKTITINTKVSTPEAAAVTVAAAREVPVDESVTFKGIVTGIANYESGDVKYIFLSDVDGTTIAVYNPTDANAVLVGDLLKVTGTRATHNGLEQIGAGSTVAVLESDQTVPAATVLTEFPTFTADDQGKRYSFEGLTVVSASGRNLRVTDGTTEVLVYVDINKEALTNHIATAVGKKVDLVNIHLGWYNSAQFLMFNTSEVVIHELTDQDKLAADKAELEALYHEKTFNGGEDITLPTAGTFGSTITWTLNPEDIIADGKWKAVAEDTTATLTAALSAGEGADVVNSTAVLSVTVKYVDPGAPAPVTVKTTLPSAQVTVTDELNLASSLGLDATIFTVHILKNGANDPALRTDGIRMYSLRDVGSGNLLKIQIAEGYKIKAVSFERDSGTTTDNGTVHVDGTLVLERDNIFTTNLFEDLNASLFQLDNSHSGGSKNLQIRFLSITITYVKVS